MVWLEVIKLRSAGKSSALMDELLMSMSKVTQSGLVEMNTCRHAALDTDLSVYLHWESERKEQTGAPRLKGT